MKVKITVEDEEIDAEQVLKKKATKFGDVGHIIVPKNFIERDVVVLLRKLKLMPVEVADARQKKFETITYCKKCYKETKKCECALVEPKLPQNAYKEQKTI